MPIEITEKTKSIRVTYRATDGSTASAEVVGESLESVKDRAEDIVATHSLKQKVEDNE